MPLTLPAGPPSTSPGQGLTEAEAYRKYFQPFVLRGELDTSPTMLLGAMTSGAARGLRGWARGAPWHGADAPPCASSRQQLLSAGVTGRPPHPHPHPTHASSRRPAPLQGPRRCCSGWAW